MSRHVTLALFGLLCLVQLVAAGSGIARHELALQRGTVYRFETAPVDPLDLFRGRYVQLAFEAAQVRQQLPAGHRGRVYAVLGVDARGFAVVTQLRTTPPADGDYLHVQARAIYSPEGEQRTQLELPFERFYMEESKAPEAERLYRRRAGDGQPAYALVRVHEGLPVLEDLIVDGQPIADYVDANR